MEFFVNFRTFLKFSKCKALGDFLISFFEITIPKGCLGGINQNSIFGNWFEILNIFRHWLLNKYDKTSSCYHLWKFGMMFRVELKKGQAKGLCVVLVFLCCVKFPRHVLVLICEWNSAFKTILSSLRTVSHHT